MDQFKPVYKPFGESAILIEWPQNIAINILNDIRLFVSKIEKKNFEEILEFNFVYNSLLIQYNSSRINFNELKLKLNKIYLEDSVAIKKECILWDIPVCYDLDFGIDLQYMTSKNNMDIDVIISLHSNSTYTVFGIGFLPGFLYLGGLPKVLHFPRKETPRLRVPKGAIGIGGNQTGIYPQESPGGWQIIGNTPVSLFQVDNGVPCKISAGDKVKFCPISKIEFSKIEELNIRKDYELKQTIFND